MKKISCVVIALALITFCNSHLRAQGRIIQRDSIVYNIIFRDTIVYRSDTVRVRHYMFTDTLSSLSPAVNPKSGRKRLINPNSWGIGPSVGAYYSPFNGFDVNIGFGVQYYFLAIPSFKNPHLGRARRTRR